MTPDTPATLAIRRFRWGGGLVLITPLTLLACFGSSQGFTVMSTSNTVAVATVVLSWLVVIATPVIFVGGFVLLWFGSRPRDIQTRLLRVSAILLGLALPFWIPLAYSVVAVDPGILSGLLIGLCTFVGFLIDLAAGALVVVAFAFALGKGLLTVPRLLPSPSSRRRWVTIVVGICLLALVAIGLYVGLVSDPLAQSPGHDLAWIYAGLAKAGDLSSAVTPLVIWAIFWAIPIILLFVPGLLPARPTRLLNRFWTPRAIITVALGIAGTLMISEWVADFGMGLDVAEDVSFGAGGTSFLGALYNLAGIAALAAAVVRTVAPPLRVRARSGPAPAPEPAL